MVPLLELVFELKPRRLLIGDPPLYGGASGFKASLTPGCLEKLASSLRCRIHSLRAISLYPTIAEDASHVAKLLWWCPNLQQCDLTGSSMTMDDVCSVRFENQKTKITI